MTKQRQDQKEEREGKDVFDTALERYRNWLDSAETPDGAFARGSTIGLAAFLGQRGLRKILRGGKPINQSMIGPTKAGAMMIATGYPNEIAFRAKHRKKK